LSDIFPIRNGLKQGDVIRRVQVNQDGKPQLLFYVHDVNILGGSVHTIKKNTETLLVGSKETGLEVNVDKTKYMVKFRDRKEGQSHNIKIDGGSFERVEGFKCLVTTLTN